MTDDPASPPTPHPRRRRCTLRASGHTTQGSIIETTDRPALWVHGTIEALHAEVVDEVPGAQPVRFVPDLTQPHTVEDPIGIPIELFHHSSIEIRRRIAMGLTPVWYPGACVLVVGHRRFDMSLVPVPECQSIAGGAPTDLDNRERSRAMLSELRRDLYHETFTEWMRYRDVERLGAPPLRIFEALLHVWSAPDQIITADHLEFRDALLAALALLVDVHKRADGDD